MAASLLLLAAGSALRASAGHTLGPASRQILLEPTPPRPVSSLFPGWAPAKALFLSVPLDIVKEHPDRREYFLSKIRAVAPHLEIVILYDEAKEGDLYFWMAALEKDEEIKPHVGASIRHFPSKVQSEWMRDFGPFFGLGQDGELLVFDQAYQGLEHLKARWSVENRLILGLGNRDDLRKQLEHSDLMRFLDTITPNFITTYLMRRYLRPVELVRPPVGLVGGDFATDGEGRIFITEDTLLENGGSRAALMEIFREYYGARELHVLFANPGRTTRHLDMSFKLVSPTRALLVEPSLDQPVVTAQHRLILRELKAVAEANRAYLEKHLPHIEVLSLPMPPPPFFES